MMLLVIEIWSCNPQGLPSPSEQCPRRGLSCLEKTGPKGFPHLTTPGEGHGHREVSSGIFSGPKLGRIPVSQKDLIQGGHFRAGGGGVEAA